MLIVTVYKCTTWRENLFPSAQKNLSHAADHASSGVGLLSLTVAASDFIPGGRRGIPMLRYRLLLEPEQYLRRAVSRWQRPLFGTLCLLTLDSATLLTVLNATVLPLPSNFVDRDQRVTTKPIRHQ